MYHKDYFTKPWKRKHLEADCGRDGPGTCALDDDQMGLDYLGAHYRFNRPI
jgi:hypothetical protein